MRRALTQQLVAAQVERTHLPALGEPPGLAMAATWDEPTTYLAEATSEAGSAPGPQPWACELV